MRRGLSDSVLEEDDEEEVRLEYASGMLVMDSLGCSGKASEESGKR